MASRMARPSGVVPARACAVAHLANAATQAELLAAAFAAAVIFGLGQARAAFARNAIGDWPLPYGVLRVGRCGEGRKTQ